MMRILITGSKGLIGSALKEALKRINIDTIGIDHRFPEDDPEHGNILDQELMFSLANQVEGIVHLAAVSRVIDGQKDPELCWLTNLQGTIQLVEAALLSETKPWVIYASSREVYGQPTACPVKESDPLIPMNLYGRSKYAAEQVIDQGSERGLVTAIVRFSNVYGSVHDYPDRVIPAFCRAAAEGSSIRVEGHEHVFDFTYLEDVVQGLLSLIRVLSRKTCSLPPIHLTSGHPTTLGQIAQIAQQASEYPIKIYEGIPRSFDVSTFWGDPTRAEEILKWKACVSVEEGMRRLIHQYQLLFKTQESFPTGNR